MACSEMHWEVTNKCNLRCRHCLLKSGRRRIGELSTKEAMAALTEFRSAGVATIYFTGGEPFSRPDMFALLERASCLGMRVEVITNATLLTQEAIEEIGRLGVKLGISLDGADAPTNDVVHGKGSFERIVRALTWCRINNVPVTLYATVSNANFARLREIGELALVYGCVGIHFSEITLGGRALEFSRELALSTEQKIKLPGIISQIAKDVFNDNMSPSNEDCWADGKTLYMSADGSIYFCSEIFQRRPDFTAGNIKSFPLGQLKEKASPSCGQKKNGCCYGTRVGKQVVLINNTANGCVLAPEAHPRIKTLAQFYSALANLYFGIEGDCRECQDRDCVGYVWLLKEEADRLYDCGVPLVQVNNGPSFIHSFPKKHDGQLDLSVQYPPCSQLCSKNRWCSIRENRPLVCRLYPIGLETKRDGAVFWALHRGCLHVRKMEEYGFLPNFEWQARQIVENISPRLLKEILTSYRAVYAISDFPLGENNYGHLSGILV